MNIQHLLFGDAAMVLHIFSFCKNTDLLHRIQLVSKSFHQCVQQLSKLFDTIMMSGISKNLYLRATTLPLFGKFVHRLGMSSCDELVPNLLAKFAHQVTHLSMNMLGDDAILQLNKYTFSKLQQAILRINCELLPSLKPFFENCPQLQELILERSALRGTFREEDFQAIAGTIKRIKRVQLVRSGMTGAVALSCIKNVAILSDKLTRFDIYISEFQAVDALMFMPNLKHFTARVKCGTKMTTDVQQKLGPALEQLKQLEEVSLHGMQSSDSSSNEVFSKLPVSLVKFHLWDSTLEYFPEISHLKELKKLMLSSTVIQQGNPEWLQFMPKLKSIDISRSTQQKRVPLSTMFVPATASRLSLNVYDTLHDEVLANTNLKELVLKRTNEAVLSDAKLDALSKSLTHLSLCYCAYLQIPESYPIDKLKYLKKLSVEQVDNFEVPLSLCKLKYLRYISLVNCNLTSVPLLLLDLQLTELDLKANKIATLPDSLLNNSCVCKLETLGLANNVFTMVPNFSNYPSLTVCNMRLNPLSEHFQQITEYESQSLQSIVQHLLEYLYEQKNATFLDKSIQPVMIPKHAYVHYIVSYCHRIQVVLIVHFLKQSGTTFNDHKKLYQFTMDKQLKRILGVTDGIFLDDLTGAVLYPFVKP